MKQDKFVSKTVFLDHSKVPMATITIEAHDQDPKLQLETLKLLHEEVNEKYQDEEAFLSIPISDVPKFGHCTYTSELLMRVGSQNQHEVCLMDKLNVIPEHQIIFDDITPEFSSSINTGTINEGGNHE
ncbi:MAG TPA: hypothetical protein VLA13_08600 [Massilibacterium sp.]|nr:hypothetical protein [Massilibacterium sp.]